MKVIETSCPVCGRDVCVHEDGTLWEHYMSWMNQDNPTYPSCLGSGMKVMEKELYADD